MVKKKKKQRNIWQKALNLSAKALYFSLKWRYLLWALVCVLIAWAVTEYGAIAYWFGGLDWVLIKDYLVVIVAWPVAVLVLGLIFMHKFSDSIRDFLRKMDRFKVPGVEVSQQQSTTPPAPNDEKEQKTVEELESKTDDGSLTLTKQQVDELVRVVETMDFRFLNLHLVQNTKNVLRLIAQVVVKKSVFLQSYLLPPQITDQVAERQAILDALFEAQLIEEENDVLKATDKGVRFLAFVSKPVQQTT